MRRIVAGFAASLDGYIERVDGSYDWIVADPEINFAEQMKRYDAYLIGRVTYERMKHMPIKGSTCYVISNSLTRVEKGFTLLNENIFETITQLKNSKGKDIAVFGGASLLASLLNMKLVDELVVSIIPVLLGSGKPMVQPLAEMATLHLLDIKRYGNGTVQLTYSL